MDEAERRCRAFLASHERRAGQIDARLASVLTQLAALRQARGDLFEAEALYLRALDTLATAAESDESCRVACIDGLAGLFDATACDDEARRLRAGMWRV